MIILRYLLREVLSSTLVISGALLLFSIGNRFSQYLGEAWRGDLAAEVVFVMIGFRIPEFLSLIVPLSFFLAILVAYGRLYVDNEMAVLSSGGMSKRRLVIYSMVPAVVLSVFVAAITLYIGPKGAEKVREIKDQQNNRNELSVFRPNVFQSLSEGEVWVYFQSFDEENGGIRDVFIAEMATAERQSDRLLMLTAEEGREYVDPESGQRYLLLRNGRQYQGRPGEPDYHVATFASHGYWLQPRDISSRRNFDLESAPTSLLWTTDQPLFKAELHWRMAFPIMVLLLTLLAVPLSYTNPRQGRFLKLFPAIFCYIFYVALLIYARNLLEEKDEASPMGLWWVHGLCLLFALSLGIWNNGQPLGKFFPHRSAKRNRDVHATA